MSNAIFLRKNKKQIEKTSMLHALQQNNTIILTSGAFRCPAKKVCCIYRIHFAS